jgi:4-phosphopantoate--beta-alanine ligase
MPRVPRTHPRYASLRTRAKLAEAAKSGLVVPEGLIAHGRGEAFDYLLGEHTTPSARNAIRLAAEWLYRARRPVVSVNGNAAALAARHLAALARALPSLSVEVNLFHRTPKRVRLAARVLRSAGVPRILGVRPTVRVPGLRSDRGWVDRRGIAASDICLVLLEDGDRTEALRRWGKHVIAIDLNPLSRTAQMADLPIIDELTRALSLLTREIRRIRSRRSIPPVRKIESRRILAEALWGIDRNLSGRAAAGPRLP